MVTLIDTSQNETSTRDASSAPAITGHAESGRAVRQRHPDSELLRKPDWIRVKAPGTGIGADIYKETQAIVNANNLVTVCQEAGCPNIGECWSKKHATLMIMGDTCTRACAFCNVRTGIPLPLDPEEPANVADAVAKLGLNHVVITSVDRDDLADGGAQHFADVIHAIRLQSPQTTIEILTPDFLRKEGALEIVVEAKPDVFNHNLETVPSNYLTVRPGARYFHSIRLLQRVKELLQLMDDLRSADVDFITIGQYLQPTRKHHPILKFVTPDEFKAFETVAYSKGFLMVSSSPLTRSSHHAGEDFARLRAARAAKLDSAA